MKTLLPFALAVGVIASGTAVASDDCHSPMANWKSKESLTAHVAQLGVTTNRIKVDDGCYEVHGKDQEGNHIELKVEPATLAVKKLEVEFAPSADTSRYFPKTSTKQPKN